MEIYNVVFDAENDLGVYGISLVSEPAMESSFIAFNKHNIQLAEVDKKEHILAGVVLIPDKKVYRNQDGREFYLTFNAETIKEVAQSFVKNGFQKNSTIEHQDKIEGVSIVQSWVVKDPENDTANAYGLPKEDIKQGSWVVLYKCDNKEVYDKALKGEITGFSIDGLFNLEKVNLKKVKMEEIKNFKDEIIAEFKAYFTKKEETEVVVTLGKAMLKDGETTIEFVGDEMVEGADVFIVNGDDNAPLPVGEYILEDDKVLIVVEEGKISEVKEIEEEVEEIAEENTDDIKDLKEEMKQMLKALSVEYATQTKSLIDEITTSFETKLSEQKEIIEELKKTPVATPIKSAPTQLSKGNNATERLLNVINKNK